jgi:hypothetical protein
MIVVGGQLPRRISTPDNRDGFRDKKGGVRATLLEESPGTNFVSITYFKIGFWDGLSPKVGGGLFFCIRTGCLK